MRRYSELYEYEDRNGFSKRLQTKDRSLGCRFLSIEHVGAETLKAFCYKFLLSKLFTTLSNCSIRHTVLVR